MPIFKSSTLIRPELLFIFLCTLSITKSITRIYTLISTQLLEPQYINPSNYHYISPTYKISTLFFTLIGILAILALAHLYSAKNLLNFKQRFFVKILMIIFTVEILVTGFRLTFARNDKVKGGVELGLACIWLVVTVSLNRSISRMFSKRMMVSRDPRISEVEV